MQTSAIALMLSFLVVGFHHPPPGNRQSNQTATVVKPSPAARQLLAVRGEVVKKKAAAKGWLQLTIKPPAEFPEVTVMARENDRVGSAINRSKDTDLLGLLSESERDNDALTAAEIEEGDFVSVIYDPQSQNRALEIYIH